MDYYSEKLVSAIIIILGILVLIIIILFGLKLTFQNLQEQVDLKGNLIHYYSFDCCQEPEYMWKCSALNEIGKYFFEDGVLTSPSGKKITCLQEQVPTCNMKYGYYGFKVVCSDDFFGWKNSNKVIDQHFHKDLESCKQGLKFYISYENCEVIE